VCARYDSIGNLRHICCYLCTPTLIVHSSWTWTRWRRAGSSRMADWDEPERRWARCLPANQTGSVRYRTDDGCGAPYAAYRPLDRKQPMKSGSFAHSMRYNFRRLRARRQCASIDCSVIETRVRRSIAALRREAAGRVDIGVLASLSAGRSHGGERRLAAVQTTRSGSSRPDPIYRAVPRTSFCRKPSCNFDPQP
jgi:hypothetical protein